MLLASAAEPEGRLARTVATVRSFVDKRYFLVGVTAAVALAAAAPGIGRKGGILRPELTVAWGATCSIFLISGLTLPTSELKAAASRVREHAAIQTFNLALFPAAMLGVCALVAPTGLLPAAALDGMLVMSALPTTVNMCVALTRAAGGSEALAIFNAVLGNVLGVFLTPPLLLLLVGRSQTISMLRTLKGLSLKVSCLTWPAERARGLLRT